MELKGDTTMTCYILDDKLVDDEDDNENQKMAYMIEHLVRIVANHYHPFVKTLDGRFVEPRSGSLLLIVSIIIKSTRVLVPMVNN